MSTERTEPPSLYDGRVRTDKKWWQFWKPEYDPDKWICQHCGVEYNPWGGTGSFHEMKLCKRSEIV